MTRTPTIALWGIARGSCIALLAISALLGGLYVWVGWAFPLPTPSGGDGPRIRLYAGAEEIAILHGLSRRAQLWRPLSEYPEYLVDAVLIAEDRRFFRHGGLDGLAIVRAAGANLRGGKVRQGGSTITQQLVRTLFLTGERTWGRKLREGVLALLIERRYAKDRILEAYLNTVYLGHDGDVAVHGLPAAAWLFLRKELAGLRVDEAALLAAAISSPNPTFTDTSSRSRAVRDAILRAMQQHGKIDASLAQEALARPLPSILGNARRLAPYFIDLAREEIGRRLVLPATGEVRVTTSLDPALQRIAERSLQQGVERVERRRRGQPGRVEAALVALDPTTGRIRALVGGKRYQDSPFNRATRANRQPGSIFKPIVYVAAFESGVHGGSASITPASLVRDEALTVQAGDRTWTPRNMDRRLVGDVTVRRAVEESRNVPAVRVAMDVGLERVVEVARHLGIRSPLAAVPSLALGTSEVTLLEITSVYAVLAAQGLRATPTTLDTATGSAGTDAPLREPASAPPRVVSPESAFLMTNLLRGVMREGTGKASARWNLSQMTAGKSGTSNGLRDAWFIGYTPDLVVGVWVGLDDGSPLGLSGAEAALPIWAATMAAAVRRTPPAPFTPPSGIVFVPVDRNTGKPASFWCDRGPMVDEAFRAGTEPSAGCDTPSFASAGRNILGWFQGLFR